MKALEKQDAKTQITKFLTGEAILLSSEEEKILARWELANEQLVKKEKSWAEIRDAIAFRFAVSKFTAQNDIVNAQEVYGLAMKINKKFLLHLHADRIDRDIEKIRRRIFSALDDDGKPMEITPDPKEIAALARLHESYTYTLNSIPDEISKEKLPPPIFVFNLPPGVVLQQPLDLQAALKQADELIDYIEIKNGHHSQPDGSASEGEDDAAPSHDDPAPSSE